MPGDLPPGQVAGPFVTPDSVSGLTGDFEGAGFGCVPVFVVDPRCRRDVCLLIEAALSVLDPVARA